MKFVCKLDSKKAKALKSIVSDDIPKFITPLSTFFQLCYCALLTFPEMQIGNATDSL